MGITTCKNKWYRMSYLSDMVATRIMLAISEIVWAIALFLPGETFSRSKTYGGMADLATENTWGFIWLVSALIQIYIVWTEDFHSRPAVIFAGFNAFLWLSVTASLYIHVWPPNAVASGDFALTLAAIWVFVRSGYTPKPEVGGNSQWT